MIGQVLLVVARNVIFFYDRRRWRKYFCNQCEHNGGDIETNGYLENIFFCYFV